MKKYFLLPHCYAKTGLCLMVLFLIMFGIDLAGAAPKIKVPMPYIVNEIIGEKRMVRNTTFRGYVYGDMDARHFHFAAVYRHEQGKDRRRNDNADKTQIGVFLTLVYVCLVCCRNFVLFQHCLCLQSLGHSLCIADCLYHKVPLRNSST